MRPDVANAHAIPTPQWQAVVSSDHWIVMEDPALQLLVFRRTSAPINDVDVMRRSFETASAILAGRSRRNWRVLVDTRDAPLRNDPEFETQVQPLQQSLVEGFSRVAVLVRTAVGKLQVLRLRRSSPNDATVVKDSRSVFQSEEDALRYLLT